VPFSQGIREVKVPNAEIDSLRAIGQLDLGKAPCHLDAERIVAEEDVADARNENPARGHDCSGKPRSSNEIRSSFFNRIVPPTAVTGLI